MCSQEALQRQFSAAAPRRKGNKRTCAYALRTNLSPRSRRAPLAGCCAEIRAFLRRRRRSSALTRPVAVNQQNVFLFR